MMMCINESPIKILFKKYVIVHTNFSFNNNININKTNK